MSKKIVISDSRHIKSLLRNFNLKDYSKRKYFFCDDNHSLENWFREKGFSAILNQDLDEETRRKFLQEYIDLMGLINKQQNSLEWWATDISSKNRFTSRLPYLLQQLFSIVHIIENEDYNLLFIVNPEWVIVRSLKELLAEKGVEFLSFNERSKLVVASLGGFFYKFILIFAQSFRMFLRIAYCRCLLNRFKNKSEDKSGFYIIKTFIYNRSFTENGSYQDAFFGSLTGFIKNKKDLLIFAHIAGNFKYCIRKIKNCRSYKIYPIEYFLTLSDVIFGALKLLFCWIRVKGVNRFFGINVTSLVNNELIRTSNGIQPIQFFHYKTTKRLAQKTRIDTFLLTYENNPWEKMCIMALRQNSPDTFVIGYQHAVVPQASANMFVSQHERGTMSQPDKILTVGDAPKKIMERYGAYRNDDIEAACGLRFEYLFKIPESSRSKTGSILVALEGIKDVYRMVSYIFKELGRVRDYQVVFRTHPVLPWPYFERTCGVSISDYPHFSVSEKNSLKEDIESSDIVLYWGSTVALEALSMGKPVIHFMMDSLLSYDPLFECDNLKWTVSSQDSLLNTIKRIYQQNDQEFMVALKKAREYLASYFYPITNDRQAKFLKTREDLQVSSTEDGQQTFAVVIPTKNRINDLLSAVKSVLSQSRRPDELIIVDQSITDATDSVVRSLLANRREINYKYIFNNTLSGLTAAKNVAVKASGSDILLFIDDDIVLDNNFIQVVLGVFEQRPELSGVGGVVQLPAHRQSRLRGLITSIFRIGPFKDVRILLQYGCYTKDLDVIPSKFLSGGLSALRRDLFQHVEFDGFLKGASVIEDLDFYSRANGFKFALARRAVALHNFSPVSRAGLCRSFEQKCAGFVYVFYNHIPKTPYNIFAFFWRNVGFLLDAIFESLRCWTFDPFIGIINGWIRPFNNSNFVRK